jgi:hypothetical protein
MANIKDKDLSDFSTWNMKELRKLKINIKNRLESLNSFRNNSKELQKNNILFGKESGELQGLLTHIAKAEKKLAE